MIGLTRKRTVGSDRNPFQDENRNQAVLFGDKEWNIFIRY